MAQIIPMKCIVYKVLNKCNGKVYIGQTTRKLNKRITDHYVRAKKGSNYRFHQALRKYDRDNFEWSIIGVFDNRYTTDLTEEKYISLYNSTDYKCGYNMSPSSNSISDEARRKISSKNKGRHHTQDVKDKIREITLEWYKTHENVNKGKRMGADQKEKLRISAIKRYSEGVHPRSGAVLSEDTKRKIGEKAKERLKFKENNGMYGRKHSDETKKKLREKAKLRSGRM